MIHLLNILAETTGPMTQSAPAAAAAADQAAKTWHAPWEKWLTFYSTQFALTALGTFAALVLSYWILTRIFKKSLVQHHLQRSTALGAIAAIFYFTLLAAHPLLMVDPYDMIAVTIHKTFAAILCLVAIRYLDRLLIVPILMRISGGPPSRFIHQIVIAVISLFVIAGYCSWAFGIELGSLLAGSAVISIVIGLALQETLGNFFSGMVLQASVPFQPGDWIQVGDVEGRVIEMTWRAVTLITNSNNYVLIPNGTVAKERIVNYHSPTVATSVGVAVGLDYNIPPNDAKRVLVQAAKDTPGVNVNPEPSAALASFDDSAITYKVFFWINEPQKHGGIEQAVRVNIWYRLNQAGFGIPFPIRTVELTDSEKKQAALRAESRAARLAVIRKAPLFSDLIPELQEKLANETRDFALAAGQTFYRQDDPGDSLFILQSGSVAVTVRTEDGIETDLPTLEAPTIFGEISAVTGQARGGTYRAKTDVRAFEIDRDHLQDLFTHDPNLATHFSHIVAERQRGREELLKKVGAKRTPEQHAHSEPHNVLDRMKRLFALRIR
ncbi:MAG TPA: mechanosensitive ion channel family protein [Phycisphaerae bacterium]|nr:mechanosensitive ion channel family protein [Phycisphaerae bacterium]